MLDKTPSLSEVAEAESQPHSLVIALSVDPSKEQDNLRRFVWMRDFPNDDIVPSINGALRQAMVDTRSYDEESVAFLRRDSLVNDPLPVLGKLKIAIVTHLRVPDDSYSPARAIRRQAEILRKYGHDVTIVAQEGAKIDGWGFPVLPAMAHFRREKGVIDESAKDRTAKALSAALVGFDVAISHDMYLQDCVTYREAIKACGARIGWVHFARSGIGHNDRLEMPNAIYGYLNRSEAPIYAERLGVTMDRVVVLPNEKDPSVTRRWDLLTVKIVDHLRLWEKDVVQVFPLCSTRMDAKGATAAILAFAAIKRAGKSVCLMFANSNARKREQELKEWSAYALSLGLNETDCVFLSELPFGEGGVRKLDTPNRVVNDLMGASNLFIFPTTAEVSPNVLLEAMAAGNLLVLNSDLPLLGDFVDGSKCLWHAFGSHLRRNLGDTGGKELDVLAEKIVARLEENWSDAQFRHVWRENREEAIYRNYLAPILTRVKEIN